MLVLEKLKVVGDSVPTGAGRGPVPGPVGVGAFDPLFAGRVKGVRGSAKRDLSAAQSRPGVISLAGGHPDTSIFEEETLERAAFAFVKDGATALQYGPSDGLPATRDVIVEVMRAERMPTGCENVFVTNGAQQGLELMGKVFLEEGDAVLTEAPTYFGALNAFAAYRPRILPVPMDERGDAGGRGAGGRREGAGGQDAGEVCLHDPQLPEPFRGDDGGGEKTRVAGARAGARFPDPGG